MKGTTVLAMGGAVCGGCGADLPALREVYFDERWLFCDEACAEKWPGHPPLGWNRGGRAPEKEAEVKKAEPRVVNCKTTKVGGFVLVDRTTDWGNFDARDLVHEKNDLPARLEAVAVFRRGLARRMRDPAYRARLREELGGRSLGCHCAPHPCHARVLLAAANSGTLLE